ncbi:MAG: hypothetical protein J5511_02665 [Bacilli bacterium]|nr:hypothetical protein [Bacilli bacterium]
MNFITESFTLIIRSINALLPPLAKAMLSFITLFDSFKEQIIAAGLGVPVIVVSIASGVFTVTGITYKVIKHLS